MVMKKRRKFRGGGVDRVQWRPCYTVVLVFVILLILGAIAVAIWAGVTFTKS